jgi:hypothetical protein
MEFNRCRRCFVIRGVRFRCDLQRDHSGDCISLPDGPQKVATVMWPKERGF